jgi:hypothetical protein
MRMAAAEQLEGMGHDVEDRIDRFDRTRGRTGQVYDQTRSHGPCDPPREAAQRAGSSHGLGQPGRLTLEERPGGLRGEVSR